MTYSELCALSGPPQVVTEKANALIHKGWQPIGSPSFGGKNDHVILMMGKVDETVAHRTYVAG